MHMNVITNERAHLYDTDFIRSFIAYSRRIDPYIPEHLVNYITQRYVQHRNTSKKAENQENPHSKINKQQFLYVTPRFLLGIIRLSQALARLHLREEVREDDINEAIRLIECSRLSIIEDQQTLQDLEISRKQDEQSRVWGLIRELLLAAPESNTLSRNELFARLEKEGISPQAIEATITSYTMLDSLYVDDEMETIMLC